MTPTPGDVLLVRLSAIGDVVHTLPVAAALERRGWRVTWIVEPAARPLLEGNPAVAPGRGRRRRRAPGAWARCARRPPSCGARGATPPWTCRASGSRRRGPGWPGPAARSDSRRAGGASRSSSVLLTEQVSLDPEAVHVIDKNLALLVTRRHLGARACASSRCRHGGRGREVAAALQAEGVGRLRRPEPRRRLGEQALARGVLRPPRAAACATAAWPALVTWGPGEEKLADRVVAASDGRGAARFPTTLLEYVELARRARLFVAADTGPLHLACAIGDAGGRDLRAHRSRAQRPLVAGGRHRPPAPALLSLPSPPLLPARGRHARDPSRRGAEGDRPPHWARVRGHGDRALPSRLRVPLGWVAGAVVVALARPRPWSLLAGLLLGLVGEAIRIWASGPHREDEGAGHGRTLRAHAEPAVPRQHADGGRHRGGRGEPVGGAGGGVVLPGLLSRPPSAARRSSWPGSSRTRTGPGRAKCRCSCRG